MARKGKVPVTVDGVRYRAAAEIDGGHVRLIVQREAGGQRLQATFDPFVLEGRTSSWHDYVAKSLIVVAIREATARGWRPDGAGPPFVLPQAALVGEHRRRAWVDGGRGRELLDVVLADPDALEPRLVLADWLAERDDPRAALIRAQCAGEAAPELLRRYWRRWSAPVQRVAHRWAYWRGFVDDVTLTGPPDPAAWTDLHTLEPIRRVELAFGAGGTSASAVEGLRTLVRPQHRILVLSGVVHGEALRVLAAGAPVRRLDLVGRLADDTLPALLDEAFAAVEVCLAAPPRGGFDATWLLAERPRWRALRGSFTPR